MSACIFVGLFSSCSELDDPTKLDLNEVITVQTKKTVLSANGLDTTAVTAELTGDTPDGQLVTFKTDIGSFAGIPSNGTASNNSTSISLNANAREASVFLISGIEEGTATVSASVGNFTNISEVIFQRVNPDRIVLTSNRTEVPADGNSTVALTVNLLLSNALGTVTEKTRILFRAENDSTGQSVPALDRVALSDNQGVATTSITGTQQGRMRIISTVDGLNNLADTILVQFN